MRVKCFAQEHKVRSSAGTRTWIARFGVEPIKYDEGTAPREIARSRTTEKQFEMQVINKIIAL